MKSFKKQEKLTNNSTNLNHDLDQRMNDLDEDLDHHGNGQGTNGTTNVFLDDTNGGGPRFLGKYKFGEKENDQTGEKKDDEEGHFSPRRQKSTATAEDAEKEGPVEVEEGEHGFGGAEDLQSLSYTYEEPTFLHYRSPIEAWLLDCVNEDHVYTQQDFVLENWRRFLYKTPIYVKPKFQVKRKPGERTNGLQLAYDSNGIIHGDWLNTGRFEISVNKNVCIRSGQMAIAWSKSGRSAAINHPGLEIRQDGNVLYARFESSGLLLRLTRHELRVVNPELNQSSVFHYGSRTLRIDNNQHGINDRNIHPGGFGDFGFGTGGQPPNSFHVESTFQYHIKSGPQFESEAKTIIEHSKIDENGEVNLHGMTFKKMGSQISAHQNQKVLLLKPPVLAFLKSSRSEITIQNNRLYMRQDGARVEVMDKVLNVAHKNFQRTLLLSPIPFIPLM